MELNVDDLFIQKYDDVFEDIIDHGHTHYSFPGGRGGTKSSFIGFVIPLLIKWNPGVHAAIFRKQANTLRDSVFAQIIAGISMVGNDSEFKYTVSPMEITYLPTGQKILFRGLDKPEKVKSIKVPFGYIGITWFEELDQFAGRAETRTVLQSTMRGGERFWNFESYNPPITTANWANEDIKKERDDRIVTWSNYLDVPREWLGEQFIAEADELKRVNDKAYRHEYLGEVVGTGGMVFDNCTHEEITDEQIAQFDNVLNGVDFGWYPDPWALVKCHYYAGKRTLYIYEEERRNKASNEETAGILERLCFAETVTCDSAEPKSINDYKAMGVMASPADKGPGSVRYSIKWLQSLNAIVVDKNRCPNAYKEFTECEYEHTKTGEVTSNIPDANNHFIDATRYATNAIWKRRGE